MRLIDADVLKQHIDKLPALPDGNFAGSHSALKALINMQPTVQPEERTKTHAETHACDSIGRQVAIDAVDAIGHIATMPDGDKCIRRSAVKYTLSMLPPAQPERKKGKWIKNDNGTYSCSLCHSWIPEEQYYYAQFCLYCGADMRGEPNETD